MRFETRISFDIPVEPITWVDPEPVERTAYVIEQIEIKYYNDWEYGASTDVRVFARPASRKDESRPDKRRALRSIYPGMDLKLSILRNNNIDIHDLIRRATSPMPAPDEE